jgi:lysophospholipase L1-like esterase
LYHLQCFVLVPFKYLCRYVKQNAVLPHHLGTLSEGGYCQISPFGGARGRLFSLRTAIFGIPECLNLTTLRLNIVLLGEMEIFDRLKNHWKLLNVLGWLIIIAYLSYLTVQFQTYSWWVVKWHTHLFVPVFLFWTGANLLWLIGIISGKPVLNVIKKWLYVNWLLLTLEIIFMLFGLGIKLGDEAGGRYVGTPLVPVRTNMLHTWTPNQDLNIDNPEFTYERRINSLGLADYEWSLEKDSQVYRVLCLGDSFTEGDAVAYDASYVANLRKLWHSQGGQKVEILNAGVCGSDPFYNYYHYKEVLSAYQPDLIIQTISSHDLMNDIMERGGLERFNQYNGLYRKPFRIWQAVYASNYTARVLIMAGIKAGLLVRYHIFKAPVKKWDVDLTELFSLYSKEVTQQGSKVIWVFLPGITEIQRGTYFHEMSTLKEALRKQELPYFDLMDCYLERSNSGQDIANYYWVIDQHHNAKGYRMMAECIYEGLKEKGLAGN